MRVQDMQLNQLQTSRENAKDQFRYFCMNKAPFHSHGPMPLPRGDATQSDHDPSRLVLKIHANYSETKGCYYGEVSAMRRPVGC